MNNVHPTMQAFMWFAPCRATGNHLAAQNDEPEPITPEPVKRFKDIEAEANEEARAIVRGEAK